MVVAVFQRHDLPMVLPANLHELDADALRQLLIAQDRELTWRQTKIDQLTHELSLHKRWRFGVKTERLPGEQAQLFEETVEADLAAMSEELEQISGKAASAKGQAKRKSLPPELPRTEIHHEPDSTLCACGCQMKRIGEDVAEKLDYIPGSFSVERHVRGKWACAHCETLVQAPVPAHVIDKGIPTTGLLAQVLVAKYQDHLPLYRQEGIFGRAGLAIPQSTLAQWVGQMGVQLQPLVDALKAELLAFPVLHADETPVAMLDPAPARLIGPTCGLTASVPTIRPGRSSTTLPTAAPASTPRTSSATGAAPSSATITRVMLRPKLCCVQRGADLHPDDQRSQAAHKSRSHRALESPMNSMRDGDGDRRRAAGRSVISTLASALAFISRSTSA